jgi:holo-[acyl-carrier protein] synthase
MGCDLVDTNRIQKLIEKHGEAFLNRILTSSELLVYQSRSVSSTARATLFVSTRYAAKEAFSKAMGTGIGKDFSFLDLSVLNEPDGRPKLLFSDKLSLWMHERQVLAHVSLSDEQSMAMATVLLSRTLKDATE